MKTSGILLFLSIIGLIASLIMLIPLLGKIRTLNIHKIWDLAIAGDKLAKFYCCVILFAFIFAVLATLVGKAGY